MEEEATSEFDKYKEKQALISAKELLQVARAREEKRKSFMIEYLKEIRSDLPYVKDITLDYYRPGNYFWITAWLDKGKDNDNLRQNKDIICMTFENNVTKPVFIDGLSLETYETIVKHQELFQDIANFGAKNHYNELNSFNTRSQIFNIRLSGTEFDIKLTSELFKGNFYLTEDFMFDIRGDKHYQKYRGDIATTSDGKFILETDIWGVKNLFLKPKKGLVNYCYLGEKDPTIRFLNHLQVYESDIPPYITDEVKRIRSKN